MKWNICLAQCAVYNLVYLLPLYQHEPTVQLELQDLL